MDKRRTERRPDWVNTQRDIEWVEFRWPDTDTGHLWVTVGWLLLGGRWECISIAVDFAPGQRLRPLQGKDLELLKLGGLLSHAAEMLRDKLRAYPSEVGVWTIDYDAAGEVTRTVSTKPNPEVVKEAWPGSRDRRAIPLEKLREVAHIYADAYEAGEHPTQAVKDYYGAKKATAARWVWLCRNKYGLLPVTTRGTAGSRSVDRGKEANEESGEQSSASFTPEEKKEADGETKERKQALPNPKNRKEGK